MLAFNFFFLPVHTFTLIDERDWVAFAVYLVTAIVVSDLASRARRRAAEAEPRECEETVLAELSIALLQGEEIGTRLDRIAEATAAVLGVPRARLELGARREPAGVSSLELQANGRLVGTLYVDEGAEVSLPSAGASCRRSPGSLPSRSTARSSSVRRSPPRRCG